MTRKTIIEIISGLFITLFLYTAVSKLTGYTTFENGLKSSVPLAPYATILAWLIPVVEIVVVILLFFPATQKPGMYASAGLMLGFTGYITYMLAGTTFRPCGCGGVIQSLSWPQHLVFNSVFTVLALLGIWLMRKRKKGPDMHNASMLRTA